VPTNQQCDTQPVVASISCTTKPPMEYRKRNKRRAESASIAHTWRSAASGQPGQFFAALQQQPYNSGAASPGTYAQAVQQSAYPDRYDQAFPQAVALYNQLTRGD
jgi:hypothetical protein